MESDLTISKIISIIIEEVNFVMIKRLCVVLPCIILPILATKKSVSFYSIYIDSLVTMLPLNIEKKDKKTLFLEILLK